MIPQPRHYQFDPGNLIKDIVLVGLGGTGSQIGRSIARMIYDMRARGLQTPNVLFVDPDIVEEKNVGRQMFTATDVGQHKAQLLARRFNHSLGLTIQYRNEKFNPKWVGRHWSGDAKSPFSPDNTLLIGAVDNHEARATLAEAKGATWIDSGNHFSSGQVVIGNTCEGADDYWRQFHEFGNGILRAVPNAARVFPQLLEPEPDTATPAISCADLTLMGDQQLLINDQMATVTSQYVYKLLFRQPIKTFITYVDVDALSMRSVPITEADIAAYVPRAGNNTEKKSKTA